MSLPAESMGPGSSCLARQRSARQAEATPGKASRRVASARQDEKGVPWFWKIGDRQQIIPFNENKWIDYLLAYMHIDAKLVSTFGSRSSSLIMNWNILFEPGYILGPILYKDN